METPTMSKTLRPFGLALVLAAAGASLVALGGQPRGDNPALDPKDAEKLATANHALTFDLYGRLAKANPRGNLAFSPHSVAEALALACAGARGDTAEELKKALRLPLPADPLLEAL